MTCKSCRGALPGGCSQCRPMPMRVGRISFAPSDREWKASIPSLSAAVGAVIESKNWREQADGVPGWDANGSEVM